MEEITIKDIARICGVGVSTVSRAINNHPDINPETKEMIMRVIKENNYVPNNSARNLKRQDAKAIAVLVKGINNSFFSQMIKVLEEEIKEKSYAMVLQHVDYDEDEVEVALKLVKEKRLRGIIFLGGYLVHSEEKLAQLHVPFILSTTGMLPKGFSRNTYSSVAVDDTKESYKMVDYLCKNGHKDIAILCARKTDASIGKLRLEGYKKALKDNGIEVREELILPMRSDSAIVEQAPYRPKNGNFSSLAAKFAEIIWFRRSPAKMRSSSSGLRVAFSSARESTRFCIRASPFSQVFSPKKESSLSSSK